MPRAGLPEALAEALLHAGERGLSLSELSDELPEWTHGAIARLAHAMGLPSRVEQMHGNPMRYWHHAFENAAKAFTGRPKTKPTPATIAEVVRRPVERLAPGRVEYRTVGGVKVKVTIGPSHHPEKELERTAPRIFRK
jgi:hypothetical protein